MYLDSTRWLQDYNHTVIQSQRTQSGTWTCKCSYKAYCIKSKTFNRRIRGYVGVRFFTYSIIYMKLVHRRMIRHLHRHARTDI
uniref:Uncharacterized protein n=1 Tax=Trichobilharzia regenti TaxID=157069 RepID=A0AA85JLJ6_TRIRE